MGKERESKTGRYEKPAAAECIDRRAQPPHRRDDVDSRPIGDQLLKGSDERVRCSSSQLKGKRNVGCHVFYNKGKKKRMRGKTRVEEEEEEEEEKTSGPDRMYTL